MVEARLTRLAATESCGGIGDISVTSALFNGLLPALDGVELYARRGRRAYDLQRATLLNMNVISIHGRTGIPADWNPLEADSLLWLINQMTPPSEFLLAKYGDSHDILVHACAFLRKPQLYAQVNELQSPIQKLWIENHPYPKGVTDAVDVVIALQLLSNPVNAGLTYDLFHALKNTYEDKQTFRASWKHILQEILRIKETEKIPIGLHIPIGTKVDDSLPVDWMDTAMWQDLAPLILDANIERILFQHQFATLNAYAVPFPRQVKAANQRLLELADQQFVPGGILPATSAIQV